MLAGANLAAALMCNAAGSLINLVDRAIQNKLYVPAQCQPRPRGGVILGEGEITDRGKLQPYAPGGSNQSREGQKEQLFMSV